MSKKFKIPGEQIKRLLPPMGSCMATDRITVEGASVGYMYREAPSQDGDSGWCFFSGDESQDYLAKPDNIAIFDANTIANYDEKIIPYLNTPAPCAFEKNAGSGDYKRV